MYQFTLKVYDITKFSPVIIMQIDKSNIAESPYNI